jgi:hypothetical protein
MAVLYSIRLPTLRRLTLEYSDEYLYLATFFENPGGPNSFMATYWA